MATDYKLVIKTRAGTRIGELTDFRWLTYTKAVNSVGGLRFALNGSHHIIPQLELDSQVEVWRRNTRINLNWYQDFGGLYRGQERETTDRSTFTANCTGQLRWLQDRVIAWYADTANRTTFNAVPAETVMKTLVRYNTTVDATVANGRITSGVPSGLTITNETDQARGTVIDWTCPWKNLLETLQDLAHIGGGDFDLVRTAAAAWEFRFYPGQLGQDRSSQVVFALGFGNMASPIYRFNRMDEKTLAIVAGEGEASARVVVTRTGPTYSASNHIELFVDGRSDKSDTTALNNRGDAALETAKAHEEFNFDVLQTPATAYGLHYGLGDLVKGVYGDIEKTVQIRRVTVGVPSEGQENISIELKEQ